MRMRRLRSAGTVYIVVGSASIGYVSMVRLSVTLHLTSRMHVCSSHKRYDLLNGQ